MLCRQGVSIDANFVLYPLNVFLVWHFVRRNVPRKLLLCYRKLFEPCRGVRVIILDLSMCVRRAAPSVPIRLDGRDTLDA